MLTSLVLLILVLSIAGASWMSVRAKSRLRTLPTPIPSPITADGDDSPRWLPVIGWEGAGGRETEPFGIRSPEWRIHWEARGGPGVFQIYVVDSAGRSVDMAANVGGAGRATSYVRATPDRFRLLINSMNIDYTIRVEDQR
jgi:hypothetical protein